VKTASDEIVNNTRPNLKTLLLPSQSLILPKTRTVEASGIKNAFTTQLTLASEISNSDAINGRAIAIDEEVNGVRKEASVVASKTARQPLTTFINTNHQYQKSE